MNKSTLVLLGWMLITIAVIITYLPIDIIIAGYPFRIFAWILSPFLLILGIILTVYNNSIK